MRSLKRTLRLAGPMALPLLLLKGGVAAGQATAPPRSPASGKQDRRER